MAAILAAKPTPILNSHHFHSLKHPSFLTRRCYCSFSFPQKQKDISFRVLLATSSSDNSKLVDDKVDDNDVLQSTGSAEKSSDGGTNTKVSAAAAPAIEKDLKKVISKTAATFAPRASTKSKNPAVPGTTLYTVFEVQAYASMFLGGVLSFNLLFPSNEPDLWRLMGMWSIWMFTIPSLRARDCSAKEKEALNYLFILVPLLNVIIPFFWKSFAVVWSADTIVFFMMYAWKMEWLKKAE